MRDSDRQSEFPAAQYPLRGRRGDKPRSPQASWWARTCAALVLCAAAATASPAQTFTTLHNFHGSDGNAPLAGLIQGTDGNLYGTTYSGGANTNSDWCKSDDSTCGTVFKITPAGRFTTIYNFCSQTDCTDGSLPEAGLIQAGDGNFYGTTTNGGAHEGGTIFRITPSGALTTLYSFCSESNCTDGLQPKAGLIQATDGKLYGTTEQGGVDDCSLVSLGCGTVFAITLTGALTTVYSFCPQYGCYDGSAPEAGLLQGTDGNFYGTTAAGGGYGHNGSGSGTVFKLTSGGMLTTLYSFCSRENCADGSGPNGLVQAASGNFYGTTSEGGDDKGCFDGCGIVFKITSTGVLNMLHKFQGSSNGANSGAYPYAGLVVGTDGSFWGTTGYGGEWDDGVAFKITPNGTLNFYSIDPTYGDGPVAPLVQDTNGNFYGTNSHGGAGGDGTVFALSLGLRPFVETQPTSAPVGKPINILGTSLSGSTSVTFNGTPATFSVKSPSLITTTVPAGATTGTVQVVTPGGTLSSNVPFRVIE